MTRRYLKLCLQGEAMRIEEMLREGPAPGPETVEGRELAWRRRVYETLAENLDDFSLSESQWNLVKDAVGSFSARTADAAIARGLPDSEGILALMANIRSAFEPR